MSLLGSPQHARQRMLRKLLFQRMYVFACVACFHCTPASMMATEPAPTATNTIIYTGTPRGTHLISLVAWARTISAAIFFRNRLQPPPLPPEEKQIRCRTSATVSRRCCRYHRHIAHIRLLAALGAELGQHLVEVIFVPGVHVHLLGRQLQYRHHAVDHRRRLLVRKSRGISRRTKQGTTRLPSPVGTL